MWGVRSKSTTVAHKMVKALAFAGSFHGVFRRVIWSGLFVSGLALGIAIAFGFGLPQNVKVADAAPMKSTGGLRVSASSIVASSLPADIEFTRETIPVEPTVTRPRIAIVIDDLGLSRDAFEAVNALPPPVNLSFLPYGRDAQSMLDDLRPGHEAMLHLPMEPRSRKRDAGPDMLRAGSDPEALRAALILNLDKLSGYRSVNNHTGSQFTENADAMAFVLEELDRRGLPFLDSLTTGRPVAKDLGDAHGWQVLERNVFLDADLPNISQDTVRRRLAQLERIAREDGYAIAIGHPYKETLETLLPWLITAEARGFELVPITALVDEPPRQQVWARLR